MSLADMLRLLRSMGFAAECLGQHDGADQAANLGDGNGYCTSYAFVIRNWLLCSLDYTVNETAVMRWDYGDPEVGTCKETIEGGNHFRYWTQNGPQDNTYACSLVAC
jgi:hypothetical protein